MRFSIFTIFCICFAISNSTGMKTNPRSVNLALETILQFDRESGNADLKIINDVQNIIDRIRNVIGIPRKAEFRAGSTHFTEFLNNAIKILQTYKGKDLKDVVEKLDGVLNNYQFVSFGPNSVYRRIEKFRKTPAEIIRKNLKDFDKRLRKKDFNEKEMKEVEYLEKSFANETVNLDMIVNDLKYYKGHSGNRKVNLTILLKNDFKSLLFKKTPADRDKLVQIFTKYLNLVTDTTTDANNNLQNKKTKTERNTKNISKKKTKAKDSFEKELIRESVKGKIKHKENVDKANRHKQKLRNKDNSLGSSKLSKAKSYKNYKKSKKTVKKPKWFDYSDNTEGSKEETISKTKSNSNKKSLEINENGSLSSDMETSTISSKETDSSDKEIKKTNTTNKQKSQESSDIEEVAPDNAPLKLKPKKTHKNLNIQRMKVEGVPNIASQLSSESESDTKDNGNSPEINIFVSLVTGTTTKEGTTELITHKEKSKLNKKKTHVAKKDDNNKKEPEKISNQVGVTNRYATIGFYSEENNTVVETVKAATKKDKIEKTVEKATQTRQKSVEQNEDESSESKSESNESNQEREDKESQKESDEDTGEAVEESESDAEKVETAEVDSALKKGRKEENKLQNGNKNVVREQYSDAEVRKRSNNWRLPIKYVQKYKKISNKGMKSKRRSLGENGFNKGSKVINHKEPKTEGSSKTNKHYHSKKGSEAINHKVPKTEGSSKTNKNHHSKKSPENKSNLSVSGHTKPEKQSDSNLKDLPELKITTSIEKNSIEATTRNTDKANIDSIENKILNDSNITEIQSDKDDSKVRTLSTTLKGPS